MITLISNNKSINVERLPIITEVVTLPMYLEGVYNLDNYIIVDGYETALFINTSVKYLSHNISDKKFWFFAEMDFRNSDKSYISELKEFIFNNILLPERDKLNVTIVYQLDQLKEVFKFEEGIIFENERNDCCFILFENIHLYEIDLNYFNYIYDYKTNDFLHLLKLGSFSEEEILFFSKLKTYTDVKLNFKCKGLVEKRFNKESFIEFFSGFKIKLNNQSEFYYHLLIFFNKLLYYRPKDKVLINNLVLEGLNEENSLFFTPEQIKKYENSVRNIFEVEKYLSNIQIKNIDYEINAEIVLPYINGKVQYKYNGSDSSTGRIYTVVKKDEQPLQTLAKQKRSLLKAEKNCFLIEFDYKTFEFNLLYQLAGIEIREDRDVHLDIIKHIFSDKEITKETELEYRQLGKRINYALIYGMGIENLVDSILEDFSDVESGDEKESMVLQITDLLKRKIENSEIFEISKLVVDKIKERFDSSSNLFLNHFNRYIYLQKTHALLNYYIQSLAADFLCIKIRMIIDLLGKSKINLSKNKILLQNHDSILIQLESKVIDNTTLLENIYNIVECSINGLKGYVNYGYGKDWSET